MQMTPTLKQKVRDWTLRLAVLALTFVTLGAGIPLFVIGCTQHLCRWPYGASSNDTNAEEADYNDCHLIAYRVCECHQVSDEGSTISFPSSLNSDSPFIIAGATLSLVGCVSLVITLGLFFKARKQEGHSYDTAPSYPQPR